MAATVQGMVIDSRSVCLLSEQMRTLLMLVISVNFHHLSFATTPRSLICKMSFSNYLQILFALKQLATFNLMGARAFCLVVVVLCGFVGRQTQERRKEVASDSHSEWRHGFKVPGGLGSLFSP